MSKNINWHLATACALQIDLRDYADVLTYETEHPIGKNYYRIDLLIVRKLSDFPISKALATDFRKVNLFEIKGIGSGISVPNYYKVHGYAGLYLDSVWKEQHLTARDLTLNFLSRNFPKKLILHLEKECHFSVEKVAPGIYDVVNTMYLIRFIVTKELSPKDYLYLRCLTNRLTPEEVPYIKWLSLDYAAHKSESVYISYVNEFTSAHLKGAKTMKGLVTVPEKALNLMGTSSEEIRQKQRQEDEKYFTKYYASQLQEKDEMLALMNARIVELEAQLAKMQKEDTPNT